MCYNDITEGLGISSAPDQLTNITTLPVKDNPVGDARGTVAMVFIAVDMIIQGLGKAPRAPTLTQYVDGKCNPRRTGYHLGRYKYTRTHSEIKTTFLTTLYLLTQSCFIKYLNT